jgi:methylated-DNA-[protein]-cysteine S-methyltransferase
VKLFAAVLEAPPLPEALAVAVDVEGALVRIAFGGAPVLESEAAAAGDELVWDAGPSAPARAQLDDWFGGARRAFDLRLAPRGTDFQLCVWEELATIPFGETISYGELARRVGRPGGSRAVGQANHENPIPIVLPCHRVIGSDGELIGFGGGLETKRVLLDLERGQGGLFG